MKMLKLCIAGLLFLGFFTVPSKADVEPDILGSITSICGAWMMRGADIHQQAESLGLVKSVEVKVGDNQYAGFSDQQHTYSIGMEKITYPDAETKICTATIRTRITKGDFMELPQRLTKDPNFGTFYGNVIGSPNNSDSAHATLKLPGSNPLVLLQIGSTGGSTSVLIFSRTDFLKVN